MLRQWHHATCTDTTSLCWPGRAGRRRRRRCRSSAPRTLSTSDEAENSKMYMCCPSHNNELHERADEPGRWVLTWWQQPSNYVFTATIHPSSLLRSPQAKLNEDLIVLFPILIFFFSCPIFSVVRTSTLKKFSNRYTNPSTLIKVPRRETYLTQQYYPSAHASYGCADPDMSSPCQTTRHYIFSFILQYR